MTTVNSTSSCPKKIIESLGDAWEIETNAATVGVF